MQHLGTQELETERLLLCEFDKADFHEVFASWAGDRETTKFLTWQAHADETDTKRFLAEVTKNYWRDDYYHWKIMFGGEIVGSIEVTGADERSGHCELGWVIGKAWRGRGFMPEAASAVCAFCWSRSAITVWKRTPLWKMHRRRVSWRKSACKKRAFCAVIFV